MQSGAKRKKTGFLQQLTADKVTLAYGDFDECNDEERTRENLLARLESFLKYWRLSMFAVSRWVGRIVLLTLL